MRVEVVAETLRERRRSIIWWTLGLTALVALTVAFYPSIKDDTALSDYSKDLPEAMRALFAGGEIDLVSGPGYLNSQIFALIAPVVLLIFAIGIGAAAVAGEEERGTLDLLLAQPLGRVEFVLARALSLTALVALLTAVLFVTVAVGSELVDLEIGLGDVAAASASVGLLGLLLGMVALAVGAWWPGRGRAIAVAAGIAIAAWMLDGLGQAVDVLDPWRPLSPYYQALGTRPLTDGAPWDSWALLVGLTALLAAAACVGLRRRDVRQ
jgi:ABC-2 type transport system permease protein